MRVFLLSLLFAVLAACATPDYQAPLVSAEAVTAAQLDQQRAAIRTQMARRARLYNLAWPILAANTDLCPKTRKSIGIVMADRKAFGSFVGGLTEKQLAALGYKEELRIIHVNAGSPAEAGGLKAGMVIEAVAGEAIEADATDAGMKLISKTVKEEGGVTLTVDDVEYEVEGQEICQANVKLSTSSQLNAMAPGDNIIFFAGLMRALDDEQIEFVIAHELAHVALRHTRKYMRNAIVSGGIVTGPLLYGTGALGDTTLRALRIERKGSLAKSGLAASAPYTKAFEAEADYVGLYMLARAEGNIDRAASVFDLFAHEMPGTTWQRYTHPLTPERVVAVEAAVAEIRAKEARGEELLPERK